MNERLFAELPATVPQHTRRILGVVPLDDEDNGIFSQGSYLSYCTVCAHYQIGGIAEIASKWATHLDDVLRSGQRA